MITNLFKRTGTILKKNSLCMNFEQEIYQLEWILWTKDGEHYGTISIIFEWRQKKKVEDE